ncbi:uncharacterized protein DDB_G0283697-like [Papaver somniferum]|uniref:uncharacterized protein DDB_G0283697-like n=1 Tax=Papaver somniferum TaxID=3469 RepID=UPI000E6F7693|nr:uncharacterized protein DDB_G0283697-like [Papaver somniferum]XP_026401460.1 uncharacterized protein DDB_G0283697-like [Papaver somniferum]
MVKENLSESESDGNSSKSSSEEVEEFTDNDDDDNEKGNDGMTEYEKQRLSRIQENRARLEALRLPNLAATLSSGSKGKIKQHEQKKGKVGKKSKKDDDDDYVQPSDSEEEIRVSSSYSTSGEDSNEEEFNQINKAGSSRSRRPKGKNIHSPKRRKGKKQLRRKKKNISESDFICDEEKALMQAIALSLEGSEAVNQEPLQYSKTKADADLTKRKGGGKVKENDERRKRIKPNTSRVQMTEDQVIIRFFQFDEAGKGSITKRDLQRVATEHDFSWSDEEMAAMIHCFDSDGDGKLSLEDFRKITYRCNLVQSHANSSIV